MITTYPCQSCSRLLPPPPIFSVGPPPNILSIDIRCSPRSLSSSIQHKTIISSSLSLPITLGIIIAFLITTGTILLIKNRMIKRRQRKYDDRSLSVKFNGHNHHHQQNRTNFIPLLSDSCSSDHTLSTPASEYPCGIIDTFYPNDLHHEYEQIKYDNTSHYYCLIYCHQCRNYHQTSRTYCTCHHLQNDNHLFELQPILKTNSDDLNP